jgi:hypothetical protein
MISIILFCSLGAFALICLAICEYQYRKAEKEKHSSK